MAPRLETVGAFLCLFPDWKLRYLRGMLIGKCIYCSSQEPGLSREHVIPQGLGGKRSPLSRSNALVLNEASCGHCRDMTSKMEGACLKGMFGVARAHFGMTRKSRDTGRSLVQIELLDGHKENIEVEHRFAGSSLILPAYEVIGPPPYPGRYKMPPCKWIPAKFPDKDSPYKDMNPVGQITCDLVLYARVLAKIAFCYAIHIYGVDHFKPTIVPFIVGETGEFSRHVGGLGNFPTQIEPETDPTHLHRLWSFTHEDRLVVAVKLFAGTGGPTNCIVVGTLMAGE